MGCFDCIVFVIDLAKNKIGRFWSQPMEMEQPGRQIRDEENVYFDDAEYALQLQLEEALLGSLSSSNPSARSPQHQEPDGGLRTRRASTRKFNVAKEHGPSKFKVLCNICLETKLQHKIFQLSACSHRFCSDCMASYIQTKVSEKSVPVVCPDIACTEILKPENCTAILSSETLEKWSLALTESLISDTQKFYCPYQDCSALLVNDAAVPEAGTSARASRRAITQSECPECNRLFCARCRTPWHADLKCSQVSRASTEKLNDKKFKDLMKSEKWRECPKCKRTVEKVSGCSHITCRCRYEFCYICGSEWRTDKNLPCKCPAWME